MPTVTVSGSGVTSSVTYTSNDSAPYSNTLSNAISAGLTNGSLTVVSYTGGSTLSGPAGGSGVAVIGATVPTTPVALSTSIQATVVTASTPVSITGGAAGQTVVAGSGGLTFTNITPSGPGVSYITAGDGPNLITTSTVTGGNYAIYTGAGNDTIAVNGNAVINAGTGNNSISIGGGGSLVYSEGNDVITGSTVAGGGGTDTINVGSGQATINPGTSNFVIFADPNGSNPIQFNAGSGSDTISVGKGGGVVFGGSAGNNILIAGAGGPGGAATTLHGAANGDQLYASGNTVVNATAGTGNETISGAGTVLTSADGKNVVTVLGSTAANTFTAGSGNDTLIAGAGKDTLIAGKGTVNMTAGTGTDTFQFTNGSAGGHDTITGLKASDTIQLLGYGYTNSNAPVAVGGVITLTDGTTITLATPTASTPTFKFT